MSIEELRAKALAATADYEKRQVRARLLAALSDMASVHMLAGDLRKVLGLA